VESLTRTEVRDNGMVAVLYRPPRGSGLHPAVIVVSGAPVVGYGKGTPRC
jgi:hypothetical protein